MIGIVLPSKVYTVWCDARGGRVRGIAGRPTGVAATTGMWRDHVPTGIAIIHHTGGLVSSWGSTRVVNSRTSLRRFLGCEFMDFTRSVNTPSSGTPGSIPRPFSYDASLRLSYLLTPVVLPEASEYQTLITIILLSRIVPCVALRLHCQRSASCSACLPATTPAHLALPLPYLDASIALRQESKLESTRQCRRFSTSVRADR